MAKTAQVTNALKFLIRTNMRYDVDAEGYVIYVDDEAISKEKAGVRVTLEHNNEQCPLILYQEVISDHKALPVNPFAEGLGKTMTGTWFYNALRAGLIANIIFIIRNVIMTAVKEKQKPADEPLPMEVVDIVSAIVNDVDDKTLTEFMAISKNAEAFINTHYDKRQVQSFIRCAVFDEPKWRSDFDIRKKSWVTFEKILRKLFKIGDGAELKTALNKYTRKADPNAAAHMSSYVAMVYAVYYDINVLLDQFVGSSVDLSEFQEHVNLMVEYTQNAKYMSQATTGTTPSPSHGQTIIPSTSGPVTAPNTAIPAGVTVIPGTVRDDGTRMPPVYVQSGGIPGQVPILAQQPTFVTAAPGGMGYYGQPPAVAPVGFYQPTTGYGQPMMGYGQPVAPVAVQSPWNNPPMGMLAPGVPPNRLF